MAIVARVDGCAFCAIGDGETVSTPVVWEAATWVAFFPLSPATIGHTLVVPRTHVENLWEVESALATDLMAGAIGVGRAIQASLRPQGMNLITSAGAVAEQSVFHLHIHIVPRWRDDNFGRIWSGHEVRDLGALKGAASSIRASLSETVNR